MLLGSCFLIVALCHTSSQQCLKNLALRLLSQTTCAMQTKFPVELGHQDLGAVPDEGQCLLAGICGRPQTCNIAEDDELSEARKP